MHFVYEGFTHKGCVRCFSFRGIEEVSAARAFSVEIDLGLLARYHVAVQEAPSFCLELLRNAVLAGPGSLDRLKDYRVVADDFRPLLVERERRAAEKALKSPARRIVRKPPFASNLRGLGRPAHDA
jgi:hypothetical protein